MYCRPKISQTIKPSAEKDSSAQSSCLEPVCTLPSAGYCPRPTDGDLGPPCLPIIRLRYDGGGTQSSRSGGPFSPNLFPILLWGSTCFLTLLPCIWAAAHFLVIHYLFLASHCGPRGPDRNQGASCMWRACFTLAPDMAALGFLPHTPSPYSVGLGPLPSWLSCLSWFPKRRWIHRSLADSAHRHVLGPE